MKEIRKTYTHGEITVVWQPSLCIHSRNCFHGLPEVFDPNRRPWIDPTAAESKAIIEQVTKCPSGALSMGKSAAETIDQPVSNTALSLEALPNGPLLVHGCFSLRHANGTSEIREGKTALCRCGASKNKPFCDGSHLKIGFTDIDSEGSILGH